LGSSGNPINVIVAWHARGQRFDPVILHQSLFPAKSFEFPRKHSRRYAAVRADTNEKIFLSRKIFSFDEIFGFAAALLWFEKQNFTRM